MKLKDFQKATVNHVVKQLKKNNRFLVADEVGLGKTIIARGVIEKLYKQHIKESKKPFHVIYICSNQVLANQNIKKLNIEDSDLHSAYHRLFLMIKDNKEVESSPFQISTLTPDTSFRMKKSKGTAEERAILYKILREKIYQPGNRKISLRLKDLLQGDCTKENWERKINQNINGLSFKKNVEKKIIAELKKRKILRAINAYFNEDSDDRAVDLIMRMRSAVTSVVIDYYLDADLFILDEFQRFNDLIKTDEAENEMSEIRETAKRIFDGDRKILLLSATPFKQFSTQWDIENEDDHFKGFNEVLNFLVQKHNKKILNHISERRQKYIAILNRIKWDETKFSVDDNLKQVKEQLGALYLKGLSRTERSIVEKNSLIAGTSIKKIYPNINEIKSTVNAIKYLKKTIQNNRFGSQVIEFSKSTPYSFSFLSGYKLYEHLAADNKKPDQQYLANCIPLNEWESYDFEPGVHNSKLQTLIKTTLDNNADHLLWIPPSLPYYKVPEPFNLLKGYSKTLIFSQWAMVPRAISTLLSYEQEKRIFKNPEEPYFLPGIKKNERRKPLPLLLFRSDEKHDASSNSTLLYPCLYLANNLNISVNEKPSLDDLINHQKQKLVHNFPLIKPNNAREYQYWHWFSMFHFDLQAGNKELIDSWLDDSLISDAIDDGEQSEEKKTDVGKKGKESFIKNIRHRINTWDKTSIVTVPEDIHEIIAYISIASPAVCAYRSLKKTFSKREQTEYIKLATQIASGFLTLFNKPESIQIIKNTITGSAPYWQKCLKYSAINNIQAMLDEYIYLLAENLGDIIEVVNTLVSSLVTRTSSLEIDFSNDRQKKTDKARCHFAAPYGTQKLNTQTGENRMIGIREVFNSPFRPFVLTTTSIGQEGLDFHWYCRNIYHWNLPHNPIDLEQREGRINRYKSHVIRLNHAADYISASDEKPTRNIWDDVFTQIEGKYKNDPAHCDLIPFWHINKADETGFKIERSVPIYAFSKDAEKYKIILKVLSLYRMTFGQPNQEQIIHSFLNETENIEEQKIRKIINQICLNLAPIKRS